jgi:hypothetical protein
MFEKIHYLSSGNKLCGADLRENNGHAMINLDHIESLSEVERHWSNGIPYATLTMVSGGIYYLPVSEHDRVSNLLK